MPSTAGRDRATNLPLRQAPAFAKPASVGEERQGEVLMLSASKYEDRMP
jgi:hypothetical protein